MDLIWQSTYVLVGDFVMAGTSTGAADASRDVIIVSPGSSNNLATNQGGVHHLHKKDNTKAVLCDGLPSSSRGAAAWVRREFVYTGIWGDWNLRVYCDSLQRLS